MEAEKAIEKVNKDGSESDTSFKRKLKEAENKKPAKPKRKVDQQASMNTFKDSRQSSQIHKEDLVGEKQLNYNSSSLVDRMVKSPWLELLLDTLMNRK